MGTLWETKSDTLLMRGNPMNHLHRVLVIGVLHYDIGKPIGRASDEKNTFFTWRCFFVSLLS